MIFKQKVYLNSTSNAGNTGQGIVFGFGNNQKTRLSMQVSFFSGQTGQPPSGGAAQAPTAADIGLYDSNDGVLFNNNVALEWNTAGSPVAQQNGDTVNVVGIGPTDYVKLNWSITWGSATTCTITIIAETEATK